jgi:hypothetical protein
MRFWPTLATTHAYMHSTQKCRAHKCWQLRYTCANFDTEYRRTKHAVPHTHAYMHSTQKCGAHKCWQPRYTCANFDTEYRRTKHAVPHTHAYMHSTQKCRAHKCWQLRYTCANFDTEYKRTKHAVLHTHTCTVHRIAVHTNAGNRVTHVQTLIQSTNVQSTLYHTRMHAQYTEMPCTQMLAIALHMCKL